MTSINSCRFTLNLEELQNCRNKLTAARGRFFHSKLHKLKKMLKPLFSRKVKQPAPTPAPFTLWEDSADEELQNQQNEALEARLAEDLANSPGVCGDAIRALEDGQVTLVVVHPGGNTPVPTSFFTPSPGRFSWTFLPAADFDVCLRGDVHALSFDQVPEQQTPPATPH